MVFRSDEGPPGYRFPQRLEWARLSCHTRLPIRCGSRNWFLESVRVKLIKIGAWLVRHARKLVFQLAEVAVPRALFQGELDRIGRLCPAPG